MEFFRKNPIYLTEKNKSNHITNRLERPRLSDQNDTLDTSTSSRFLKE